MNPMFVLPFTCQLAFLDSDDLYQIAILIDQLKHEDAQLRVNASRNISKIGQY